MKERELKQKLRQLKRIELIVRFGTAEPRAITEDGKGSKSGKSGKAGGTGKDSKAGNPDASTTGLIWDLFFSDRHGKPKYPLDILMVMNNEGRKRVFADYLYTVYTEGYKQRGMLFPEGFDYYALFDFDLPANASKEDIKKRFRELAKIAHPDHGGSNEAMAALLEQYHKLIN